MHETDFLDHEIGRRLKNALAQYRPPPQGRSRLLRAAPTFAAVDRQEGSASSVLSLVLGLFAFSINSRFDERISSIDDLRASYSTGVRLLGFTF
jgi:hypothetical protein